ncbi:rRNA biogenesis protein rrp5 [Zalaria obscura]|uniref:rRNA biogenesis protein rrp5 n=1 Tax=Zalaria obscura TaxID=2024903 RepID=A0ACC3SN88_9PEZI
MASEKRKAVAAERPAKRSRNEHASENAGNAKPAKAVNGSGNNEPERKAVTTSILQSEERAFPRGGASVLTPLEHKQIKLEAERDVLFEQSGKKKPKSDLYSDDEQADASAETTRPNKKRRKSGKGKAGDAEDVGPQIKIQGLSYKTISVGSMVLGQVTQITSRDVALALPNNLTGYIPLTAISEKVNQKIEALLAGDEEEEKEEDEEDDDIDLNSLFHIGQYLRAYVTSTGEDTMVNGLRKNKKHIELSVNPRQTNTGLSASDIVVNTAIQASVRSVEDHGLVMDLGLEDQSVRGFVSKKEFGKQQEMSQVQEGQVFLCAVTGLASNNKVLKLSADPVRNANTAQSLSQAPTVDVFLPGTTVDVLVTESGRGGLAGKIMGMLDATADVLHSGAGGRTKDISEKYKIGSKVKARVICTFPNAENKKVGISLLDHITGLRSALPTGKGAVKGLQPSAFVEEARVTQVEPHNALYLDLGIPGCPGFAHISRLSDKKIDSLAESSGSFRLESTHRARVLGFNPMDGVYNVSLEQKVLDQPFLRLEDIEVGAVVKGTVEKLILGAKGVTGVLVNLSEGISGLVPEPHMSDVHLQHPEKRFREGFPVTARVLSVDFEKRQIRLTLKKTLLNSETAIWKSYDTISEGAESVGTIINIHQKGAVVQFYGDIRAWLPVAEMSEAYIQDPTQHFRIGQTVAVHAISVEPEAGQMKVSCKDASAFGKEQQEAWEQLKNGQLVNATVTEKSSETVTLDIEGADLKATLRVAHMADGSQQKCQSALKQIRVGQKLTDLVVVEKLNRRHLVILSNKPSLVKAAKAGTIIATLADLKEGQEVSGFVRNVTPEGVYVEFTGGLVGLLPKSQIPLDKIALPAFGLRKDQSISSWVLSVDAARQRFVLTQREAKPEASDAPKQSSIANESVVNPVDGASASIADFTLGKLTQARIVSVKDTQINVQLADNIQGRIDVSEAFDAWEDIKDRKHPLQKFKPKQVIPVRILGVHDARNHRFLPITHRQSRIPVFELTAKVKSELQSDSDVLRLDKVEVGSSWVAFVNNIDDKCLWVNLSPNVRGRIDLMDLTEDVSLLQDLSKNFPVGSAIRVRVKHVDATANRLDLTATSASTAPVTLQTLTKGAILPGKVTKVTERNIIVQLSDSVSGAVTLTELADDYTEANPTNYSKNDILRVCVVDIDIPNKRVFLSLRPSKVLSSSLPVEDPQITSIPQLKVNDVLRGFVKAVTDKGVIVNLGPRVDAFVRVSDLSDAYIKDWKSAFQVDQLVKGRITATDAALNHVQMSLKASHVDKNFVPPLTFADLKPGQIVTGRVRKVEEFGVFIDVDNSMPRVSGLCHRSQIADTKVDDVKALYDEGDLVKAKVVYVDNEKRRISFGLKASYFKDDEDSDEEMEDDDEAEVDDASEEEDESDGGIDLSAVQDLAEDVADESSADEMDVDAAPSKPVTGLTTTGFDWTASNLDDSKYASESEAEIAPKKKKKRAAIQEDLTGDLDAHGPRSVSDFERLLLSSPNSAALWIEYMAFQLRLSEVDQAREIARRALRTIHIRAQDEKRDVWIALLNLEVSFGSAESVEEVFKEAVQLQDAYTMHERMARIWEQAGKPDEAERTWEAMAGKKEFRAAKELWVEFASFLFRREKQSAARALLQRGMQSVIPQEHRLLTARFAGLEFKEQNGDAERGRTIFEGIVAEWPKWTQGWDMWVDLEKARVAADGEDAKDRVRALYERLAKLKMKKRRARFVFKKWLEFEEKEGDAKKVERVKAIATEYVENMKGGDDGGDEE